MLRARAVGILTLGLFLAAFLSAGTMAQERKFDSITAERVRGMLRDAHQDIKKNYYDPSFHGIDWDARFQTYDERIKQIASLGQGFSIVAGYLDGLNDSHTFFLPPQRPVRVEYGFQMIMVGDTPFILRLRPGSDAASKLHPGDQVVAYNKYVVNRESLWKMDYYYNVLSPQGSSSFVLKDPDGKQREVAVDTKILQLKRVTDLTMGNSDIWELIREAEREDHQSRSRYVEMGDLLIWKMPQFSLSDEEVDHLYSIAAKHKSLILDLRENGGGSEGTLQRMIGNLFDGDVTIADRKGRKETKPLIAKGRGRNAYTGNLFVLVDSKSASAAEILARVVQLEHRGKVLGDRSSGSVMESQHFSEKQGVETMIFYGFSVTVADLVMNDGKSLEHVGVIPDEAVFPTGADLANLRDPVIARAASLAGVELDSAQAGKLFPYEWLPM